MGKLPRFRFKVQPWKHQGQALMRSWDREAFALYMQQGTGKTKVVIDNAALLYQRKKIEGLIIVAPDGVQRGWVRDEIPKHMSDDVPYLAAVYSNRPTKKQRALLANLYDPHREGLRIFAVNYELLSTKEGFAAVKQFLNTFRCLLVGDESHRFKNVKATRSKKMHDLGPLAAYRRILTGTPVSGNPLDVYSQFLFLDPSILGDQSWVAFRAQYAILEDNDSPLLMHIRNRLIAKYGREKARQMQPQLIARDPDTGMPMFQNVDELSARLKPYSYRVLKTECMDLPPKVYQKRYVNLNPAQRNIYEQLKEEFLAEYDGQVMATPLAITRLTRLQQITGGFFKASHDVDEIAIEGNNPKLASLLDACEQAEGKVLIWARFKPELALIAAALEEQFGEGCTALYWGDQTKTGRDKGKDRFQKSATCRFFVSQPKAGGTGLDGLQVASTEVYFSNEISLIDRLQSEDRGHRGGSEIHDSITIIDIEAEDTLDRKWIDSLRSKKEIADVITGDHPRNWI